MHRIEKNYKKDLYLNNNMNLSIPMLAAANFNEIKGQQKDWPFPNI